MGNTLEIEEWFCCDSVAPKKIRFGFSQFGGSYNAYCDKCSFVCAYWDCACELEHDCKEN
jgi:hypothetical protein